MRNSYDPASALALILIGVFNAMYDLPHQKTIFFDAEADYALVRPVY